MNSLVANRVRRVRYDMRVAIYTRVSTRDRGQDTANQLNQLREFCKAQGWEIVQEFEDHDSAARLSAEISLP